MAEIGLQEALKAAKPAIAEARLELRDDWSHEAVTKRLAAVGRTEAYDWQGITNARSRVFAAAAGLIRALREAASAQDAEMAEGDRWAMEHLGRMAGKDGLKAIDEQLPKLLASSWDSTWPARPQAAYEQHEVARFMLALRAADVAEALQVQGARFAPQQVTVFWSEMRSSPRLCAQLPSSSQYLSITAMEQFSAKSFEELRLEMLLFLPAADSKAEAKRAEQTVAAAASVGESAAASSGTASQARDRSLWADAATAASARFAAAVAAASAAVARARAQAAAAPVSASAQFPSTSASSREQKRALRQRYNSVPFSVGSAASAAAAAAAPSLVAAAPASASAEQRATAAGPFSVAFQDPRRDFAFSLSSRSSRGNFTGFGAGAGAWAGTGAGAAGEKKR